ncbi:MAG: dihydrodipicolinate synthase family protein [Desulfobacteraceae bacterium]|nr:MAG: dihydrodipicolinate synthase family protein [Desulfobacteraceae bacterium]
MAKTLSLKGCFPPIPTPFDLKGRVDHNRLSENLEIWQKTPLSGFVVLGSNGEAVLLKEKEKLAIWKTAAASIGKGRFFIAGTGCEATAETIELTEKAAVLGANAAMVSTPHYYKSALDHKTLVAHYTAIADKSPIPIILYNVPGFTGIDLLPDTIIELSGHPNIIGLKESSGNIVKISQVISGAKPSFQVLAGSGSFLAPALAMGAVGGVMALAAVAPYALHDLTQAVKNGKLDEAKKIQLMLIPANQAVTSRFGIAGLKAALDFMGMYGGPVRRPLMPLTNQQLSDLQAILVKANLEKILR